MILPFRSENLSCLTSEVDNRAPNNIKLFCQAPSHNIFLNCDVAYFVCLFCFTGSVFSEKWQPQRYGSPDSPVFAVVFNRCSTYSRRQTESVCQGH